MLLTTFFYVQGLLQMCEAGVEMPEMCVDGSSACLVCGDKGSGFHYSVFSCEGCKVCYIDLIVTMCILFVIVLSGLLLIKVTIIEP